MRATIVVFDAGRLGAVLLEGLPVRVARVFGRIGRGLVEQAGVDGLKDWVKARWIRCRVSK